MLENALEAIL